MGMIKTNDVCKVVETSEGALVILEGITLEINQGESVAIVGASGSGKTTLLSLLAGLDSPSEGTIVLGGDQDITVMSEAQRAKLRGEMVGFVFQTFQLLSSLTALENVMLPGELRSDPQAEDNAKKLLDRVGLGHRLQHYPRQLSGGEQQRVAIARAFASNPKILFADEPTGNLDAKTGAKIIDLLFDLNADFGTTLVLVTHDARLASRCERSILIEAGQLVSEVLETSAATA
ncbi:ABC transporter ATP-binding protein [Pseudomonadales bacterium]|jgi:putative ABC transport system ATP-binding protein|nr:ABC transporter ATP-binding protein [Gammaproteobacteria bacterium]MDA7590848.1 ABC transporter ATP-binding protein [Pseudomonadales bacterium]MCO4831548.1 ABC transporter ATP-binding protein [Gammaproteobacteria bacterium]MDA7718584.1 ABC transporter ATP-binding protein [Pseudomonadales bacterium]MDA8950932.1 ABC transporter ATP-binding protein [Pseudomonadales bacterium]